MNIARQVYEGLCKHFDIEPTATVEPVDGFPEKIIINDGEGNSVELSINYIRGASLGETAIAAANISVSPPVVDRDQFDKLVKKADRLRFKESMEMATEIISKWPAWKQNLLANGMKPMNDYSRLPANHPAMVKGREFRVLSRLKKVGPCHYSELWKHIIGMSPTQYRDALCGLFGRGEITLGQDFTLELTCTSS